MLHRVFTAMALVCVMAGGALAHPNYPGLGGATGAHETGAARTKADRGAGRNALAIARRYIGTNPTGWKRLWCAQFLNLVERKAGRPGTGSAAAKSFVNYGKRVPLKQARPGDIVVLGRKGGGHVGFAVASPAGGKIKLISGNTGGRKGNRIVAEGYYATSRVIAVVRPS